MVLWHYLSRFLNVSKAFIEKLKSLNVYEMSVWLKTQNFGAALHKIAISTKSKSLIYFIYRVFQNISSYKQKSSYYWLQNQILSIEYATCDSRRKICDPRIDFVTQELNVKPVNHILKQQYFKNKSSPTTNSKSLA